MLPYDWSISVFSLKLTNHKLFKTNPYDSSIIITSDIKDDGYTLNNSCFFVNKKLKLRVLQLKKHGLFNEQNCYEDNLLIEGVFVVLKIFLLGC